MAFQEVESGCLFLVLSWNLKVCLLIQETQRARHKQRRSYLDCVWGSNAHLDSSETTVLSMMHQAQGSQVALAPEERSAELILVFFGAAHLGLGSQGRPGALLDLGLRSGLKEGST